MNIKRITISHSNTHPYTGSYSSEYCSGDGIMFKVYEDGKKRRIDYLILDRKTASNFIKYSSFMFKAKCVLNRMFPKTNLTIELGFDFSRKWDIVEENRKINNTIAVKNIDIIYTGLKLLGIINPSDFRKGQFYIEHKKFGLPEAILPEVKIIDRISFLKYMMQRAEGKIV